MQKFMEIISYVSSENMTMDRSCRSRYFVPVFLLFDLKTKKQKTKKTGFQGDEEEEEEVGLDLYILCSGISVVVNSFKTFLSAAVALSSFSYTDTLSLRRQESFNIGQFIVELSRSCDTEDKTERGELGQRSIQENEVATL